jgi:hypothetical protein
VTDFYFTKLGEAENLVKHGDLGPEEALNQVTQEVQEELDKALERKG